MFRAVKSWLASFTRSREPVHTVGFALEGARQDALRNYREAKARGDTRRQHEASKALRTATTNALMAQVWGR